MSDIRFIFLFCISVGCVGVMVQTERILFLLAAVMSLIPMAIDMSFVFRERMQE